MLTDPAIIFAGQGHRLGTGTIPNDGEAPGGLIEESVDIYDPDGDGIDLGSEHVEAGLVINDLASSEMELDLQVDTSFTGVEPTVGNVSVEFALVSLPIALSKLAEATTSGKRTHITGLSSNTNDTITGITAHGLSAGTPVYFSAVGTSIGIVVNQLYYVAANGMTADAFKLAANRADAIDPAGTVIVISTGSAGNVTLEFYSYVHATTGRINLATLQANSRYVVRVQPWAVFATAQSVKQFAGAVSQAYGSGKGRTSSNPGYIPVPGRYLAVQMLCSGTVGTGGAFTITLGTNAQSGARHFPSGFSVSSS
jgi:hypothetical protein